MSLTAPERARHRPSARDHTDDVLVVDCGACHTRQPVSGRALGYTCRTCGSDWRVMRCRSCCSASVVLAGISACPRCGHDHHARPRAVAPRRPTWLDEPEPLSVWIGGVKYLGGHAGRDQPVSSAGLLLDRRGIHLRAFAELFSIRWDSVRGIDIEGPQDISERLTVARLESLGATTWALQVAYLTIHTANGDGIFEVDGLGPPELHARLSRVLQGLRKSEPASPEITIDHQPARPAASAPPAGPEPAARPAARSGPEPLTIDPERDPPLEVLVIDALWKLAHLREVGVLDDAEVRAFRAQLLARMPPGTGLGAAAGSSAVSGPLLHVER